MKRISYQINKSFLILNTEKEEKLVRLGGGYFNGEVCGIVPVKVDNTDEIKLWLYKRSKEYQGQIIGIIEESALLEEIERIAKSKNGEDIDNLPPFVFLTPIVSGQQDILINNEDDVNIWSIGGKKYAFISGIFFSSYIFPNDFDVPEKEEGDPIQRLPEPEDNFSPFLDYIYVDLSKFGEENILCGCSYKKVKYVKTPKEEKNIEDWSNQKQILISGAEAAKEEFAGELYAELDDEEIEKAVILLRETNPPRLWDAFYSAKLSFFNIAKFAKYNDYDGNSAIDLTLNDLLEELEKEDPSKGIPENVYEFNKFFIKKESEFNMAEDRPSLILNAKTCLIWRLISKEGAFVHFLNRNFTEKEIEKIQKVVDEERKEEALGDKEALEAYGN